MSKNQPKPDRAKNRRCWWKMLSPRHVIPKQALLADRTQPALLEMSAGEAGRTFCKQTGNTFQKMEEISLKMGDKYI